jgi:hypothetical protein
MDTLRTMRLAGVTACAVALLLSPTTGAAAADVWSGRTLFFEKTDSVDWTQPQNQDRITDAVWITRANTQGIFNIAQETGYTHNESPLDTEWATGDAADWQTLTFSTWEGWNGQDPPNAVGVNAVVHLITDDIYVDTRFESWTGSAGGGGFSYYRAPDPSSAEPSSWTAIKALYRQ